MDPVGLHCFIRSGSSRIQFDCTVGSDQDPVGSGWTALFDQIRIQSDPVGLHCLIGSESGWTASFY